MTTSTDSGKTPWYASPWLLFFAGAIILGVIVYREALMPGRLIITTDDNIGALAMRKRGLPFSFLGAWDDSALVGYPVMTYLNWTNLLLWILPLNFFNNWIHAIDLIAASFFFGRFLRLRGLSFPAIAMGCLAAVWVGSTFFLTYAGHIGKFGTVVFAGLTLWMIEKAVLTRRWPYALLAGGAMGGMFLEQPDVALFFAMPLGLYAIYATFREYGKDLKALAQAIGPLVAVAALIAIHPMYSSIALYSLDEPQADTETREEKWNYCTQWSWPPDETIEFLAPGYMGWRSGEPDGPYWGRMGQSAEWPATKQGFRNFKLETMYLGAAPIMMAVLAVFLLFRSREKLVSSRDVVFWSVVLLVTYLLALGKFFPLYRAFWMLPGISSIRNPVKFLQVWQFAFAIIAAYGVEALVRGSVGAATESGRKLLTRFALGVLAFGVILAVWASSSSSPSSLQRFQAEWGGAASAIVKNITSSLSHASLVTLVVGAIMLGVARIRALAQGHMVRSLAWALVVVAVFDQLTVSPRYVSTVDGKGFVGENDVIRTLKNDLKDQRPYMLAQEGFYNLWLTYLFPYHGVPAFNVTQARLPEDYKQFLQTLGSQPLKMWQLVAVGYIMGPGQYLGQFQRDPAVQDKFEVSFAFNAFPEPGGGVLAVAGTQSRPGEHGIMRYKNMAPRYQLIAGWSHESQDQVLRTIASATYEPFRTALLSGGDAAALPASTGEGPVGSVEVQGYRAGQMVLRVSSDKPAVLRIAEKYQGAWRAHIDGKPLPVYRCDYLFLGIPVPAGMQTVTVEYAPPLTSFWSQLAGMLACLGAIGVLAVKRG
jgi:hypothetical protein